MRENAGKIEQQTKTLREQNGTVFGFIGLQHDDNVRYGLN